MDFADFFPIFDLKNPTKLHNAESPQFNNPCNPLIRLIRDSAFFVSDKDDLYFLVLQI